MARQRIINSLNSALASGAGITAAQAGALAFIENNNGCTLTELSRGLMLDNSAITGLVDRLEKRELVMRNMSAGDRRAITVRLTDEGKKAANTALPVVKEFNAALQEGFSPDEVDAFRRVLVSIIDRFQPVEKQGGSKK